jgi:hypothetical protein
MASAPIQRKRLPPPAPPQGARFQPCSNHELMCGAALLKMNAPAAPAAARPDAQRPKAPQSKALLKPVAAAAAARERPLRRRLSDELESDGDGGASAASETRNAPRRRAAMATAEVSVPRAAAAVPSRVRTQSFLLPDRQRLAALQSSYRNGLTAPEMRQSAIAGNQARVVAPRVRPADPHEPEPAPALVKRPKPALDAARQPQAKVRALVCPPPPSSISLSLSLSPLAFPLAFFPVSPRRCHRPLRQSPLSAPLLTPGPRWRRHRKAPAAAVAHARRRLPPPPSPPRRRFA